MEFYEKLQALRKQKGMTQEQCAQALYVSRTAISKWESGRGYPNIDSLKAIARFYGVSVDELLSGEEVLTLAEEDQKQKDRHARDLVFGLLDLSAVLFFFLPLFRQNADGAVRAVSLLSLNQAAPYVRAAYFATVITMTAWGLLTLVLQTCAAPVWQKIKTKLSCAVHTACLFLFVIGLQPYAAVLLLLFLVVKAMMLIKKR